MTSSTNNPITYDWAGKSTFVAVFLLALSSLMYDLLLTRIFSVTVYYHFAFMAVSIAMFGIAVGGIVAFMGCKWFARRDVLVCCAVATLGMGISAFLAVLFHVNVPILEGSQMHPFNVLLTFLAISLPFFFGGLTLSLVFRNFARQIGQLYAADLIGASLGCLGLLWALRVFDGMSAVLFVSALSAVSSLFFSLPTANRKLKVACTAIVAVLIAILSWSTISYNQGNPLFKIVWAKGVELKNPMYERWNSFSRITVGGNPNVKGKLEYPGISAVYPYKKLIRGLNLEIDGSASTTLIGWENDLNELDVLKYDLANVANYLRPQSDVLIIGSGGGKDMVSALVFDQKHVTGLEINENTLNAVNNVFGDFTGHLDRNPKVTFVNDEARSHLSRSKEHYDIIQMPFIDTWAATANGAFVLTENSLYTREAYKTFINCLTDRGIFTVSRWYNPRGRGEVLRLLALTAAALQDNGVTNPRQHILLIRNLTDPNSIGVGTLLVSKQPFSADDLAKIEAVCKEAKYDIVVSPTSAEDELIGRVADGNDIESVAKTVPVNIRPPTDDTPFFFNMLRPIDVFNPQLREIGYEPNVHAVFILFEVLAIGLASTYLSVYIPFKLRKPKTNPKVSRNLIAYFIAIGIMFMLVEISLIQRLIVFLGHPVYGISVVVCSLLFFSGAGSYLSSFLSERYKGRTWMVLLPVVFALALIGLITPWLITEFRHQETVVRIVLSVLLVSCAGVFLGMALPLGINIARQDNDEIVPLYWGINGAGSVVGSVVAILISLSWGINTLYWCAVAGYALTVYILSRAEKALTEVNRVDAQVDAQ